jgi:putative hemin transport protein
MPHVLGAEKDHAGVHAAKLAARWDAHRRAKPKMRIRDDAAELGVSEAELVALGCGDTATRLTDDWPALVARLNRLGPVMALTRNEHAVHEKMGTFGIPSFHDSRAILLGDIDLRLSLDRWGYGFALREMSSRGARESLQFFDHHGDAIHKIYLTEASDRQAFEGLIDAGRAEDQMAAQTVLPQPAVEPSVADEAIDRAALRDAWHALQDVDDFAGVLTHFGVYRQQAYRIVGEKLAVQVGRDSPRRVLEHVAAASIDITLFVANSGAVQIHQGPVNRLKVVGPWFNVLDETFNLHLRETGILTAWVVRKPTSGGIVSSLACFDRNQELVCQICGKRNSGEVEDPAWRGVMGLLARAAS